MIREFKNGEKIETIVEIGRIIYRNGLFHILSVHDKKNKINFIIKGDILELDFETDYKFIGEYTEDKKYGCQFKIIVLTPYNELNDKDDFKKFLQYIVSSNVIDNMFSSLKNPIQAIKEGNIEELCKVKGIQEITANRIINKYKENEMYCEAYVELGKYDLTVNTIKKIIHKYKNVNTALARLKTNPYELTSINGIGWVKADEIAQKLGFDVMCKERLVAYIKHYLTEQAQIGNSWLTPRQLSNAIFDMYGKSGVEIGNRKLEILGLMQTVFSEMYNDKILYWNDDNTFICLNKYYNLEIRISQELKRLLNAENKFKYGDLNLLVEQIEKENGYKLTDEQVNAIKLCCEKNVVIITGCAGTGKTTSVQGMLKALKGYSFAQTSLSGKAASNLKEVTGEDGYTCHRLLGFQPNTGFYHNKKLPLPFDMIIVDEISMLGGELFLSLIQAIPTGSKLIMLGDAFQLPSIGVMNLLQDMLNNPIIPKQILTKIHRQASQSAIITESFKVKDGIQLTRKNYIGNEIRGELQDFTLDIYSKETSTVKKIIDYFKQVYEELQDINKIQVIVPMRDKGENSAFAISNLIQNIYNPVTIGKKVLKLKRNKQDFELRVGDKVINRKNNYNITRTDFKKTQIFNGYIGTIIDINEKERKVIIHFDYNDVGDVIISGEQLQYIELAYSITCHSFQGSQCHTVIVGLDYSSFKLLTKEWVYSSITRAKKHCILCAETNALQYAISTSDVSTKQTFLKSILDMDNIDVIECNEDNENDEDEEDEEENTNYKATEHKIDFDAIFEQLKQRKDDQHLDQYGNNLDDLPF